MILLNIKILTQFEPK